MSQLSVSAPRRYKPSFVRGATNAGFRRAPFIRLCTAFSLLLIRDLNAADPQVEQPGFKLATFSADVTPPIGHPLLGGLSPRAAAVKDPLFIKGLVLLGAGQPVVFAALDWCELRNGSYDLWRSEIAKAAGTTAERVMLCCVHQHDAPYTDLGAQALLDEAGLPGAMFDRDFQAAAIQAAAQATAAALPSAQPVTHFGTGQAKVAEVASNRRVELPGGRVNFSRLSHTGNRAIRGADEGLIDPWLKTISFWNGDTPLVAISCYATHPMSSYRTGKVSADFVGLARDLRQRELPKVPQIYATGCSGDVTAGKYNGGDEHSRIELAGKLQTAMQAAWADTRRKPLTSAEFRVVKLTIQPRKTAGLTPEELQATIAETKNPPAKRIDAALGLSWAQRCAAGQAVDLPVLNLKDAQLLILPAESFVAYQLAAQKLRPDSFVVTAGFGECGPGYMPTADAEREGFVREHGYCWNAPGTEQVLLDALRKALLVGEGPVPLPKK